MTLTAGDEDQMVEHGQVDRFAGLRQRAGRAAIGGTRLGIAAWMIMRQHDPDAAAPGGIGDNRAHRQADRTAQCIHLDRFEGEAASVGLPVRSIVADAARLGSVGVVLAHNHPSGDAQPSAADCRATRALSQAGETIDLTVLDHLIFAAGGQCHSMRRMGLL